MNDSKDIAFKHWSEICTVLGLVFMNPPKIRDSYILVR